jgi:hypothetical protein
MHGARVRRSTDAATRLPKTPTFADIAMRPAHCERTAAAIAAIASQWPRCRIDCRAAHSKQRITRGHEPCSLPAA